jgi:hypothetical protein
MTPAQQKQVQDMMNQLGQMKQEMGGSMTPQMEQQPNSGSMKCSSGLIL